MRDFDNLPEAANRVVMTHRISPPLSIERVTGPSEVVGDSVKSRWETLAAGERADGENVAERPEDLDGPVRVTGRVVWQKA